MVSQPAAGTLDNTIVDGKVFGLGLARTGTTSLHEAMAILGLVSAPDSIPLLDGLDRDFLRRHDAFFDNPIPFLYRELDAVCPKSKWIITQRPVDDWLASMRWLFGPGLDRLSPQMREIGDRVHRVVYGTAAFDPDRLRAIYDRHYGELAVWIEGRDAVWVHVDDGLDWSSICPLLECEIPDAPFPHSNRRRGRFGRR